MPKRYGKDRTQEAVLLTALLGVTILCDMLFRGSLAAAGIQKEMATEFLLPISGPWVMAQMLSGKSIESLQFFHIASYFAFDLLLFAFLCALPFGRLFHLITGAPNVFFMKLAKGTVKPVKWGVADDKLEELESFGVKKFEDFTWKHILDFYSCADCGRCSDQCPANAVGRPLSPRFISTKGREFAYKHYPIWEK